MVGDLLKEASKILRPKKIVCEADQKLGWLEAEILMAHTIKKDRSWVIAHATDSLTPSLEKKFWDYVERRVNHEPIAYIIGTKDFYGRPFFVNRSTLIPRPDTETMIDALKKQYQTNDPLLILDVGTGSGAIAITVALEFPNAVVIASDICQRALRIATKNAKLHSIEHRIIFIKGNLLTDSIIKAIGDRLAHHRFDEGGKSKIGKNNNAKLVILANLPYLPESDRNKLAKDITGFEPADALYSGIDGLDLIRELFTQISNKLNVNPNLILTEFDPPQVKVIQKLAKETFPIADISVIRDIAKKDRVITIKM